MNLDRARRLLQLSRQKLSTKRKDSNSVVIGYDASSGKYQIQMPDGTIKDLEARTGGSLGLGETGFIQGRAIAQKPHVKRVDERQKVFPRIVPPGGFYRFCYAYAVDGLMRVFIGGDRPDPIDVQDYLNDIYPDLNIDFPTDLNSQFNDSYYCTMNCTGSGLNDWVFTALLSPYPDMLVAYGDGRGYYRFTDPTNQILGNAPGFDSYWGLHSGYVSYGNAFGYNDQILDTQANGYWCTTPQSFRPEPPLGDASFFNFFTCPDMGGTHTAIGYGTGANPYVERIFPGEGDLSRFGGWSYHKYPMDPESGFANTDVRYIQSLLPEKDDPDNLFDYDLIPSPNQNRPFMALFPGDYTGFSESRQQIYSPGLDVLAEAAIDSVGTPPSFGRQDWETYGITGQLYLEDIPENRVIENGMTRIRQVLYVRTVKVFSLQIPVGIEAYMQNFHYFNENP